MIGRIFANRDQPDLQILDLGRQLYVWASTSAEMNNLALAMPAVGASMVPSATALLPGRAADAAQGVARRLALKCRQPVAVSWNVEGDELVQMWAEKELVQEMQQLNLIAAIRSVVL